MEKQKTIKSEVKLLGKGIHTNCLTEIIFKPAPPNTGIVFMRDDKSFSLSSANVINTERGTTIGYNDFQVKTVEHLLAAIYCLGIDNLYIQLNNDEIPVFDGSALEFVRILMPAIIEQDHPKQYLTISKEVKYSDFSNNKLVEIIAYPNDCLELDCTIMYDHPLLKEQNLKIKVMPESFIKEISQAKTFCFEDEIEDLRNKNLGQGGDLNNVIIIQDDKIYNPEIMSYEDEFVRHKILDFLGDLALLGKPIRAKIKLLRCGHKHNIKFVEILKKEITAQPKLVTSKELNLEEIKEIIPHRDPFLLVDRVTILEEEKKAIGYKKLTGAEDFFRGHFPNNPIMPGVLIVEALAQTACVLFLAKPELRNKLAYFIAIEDTKFRKPVLPGDTLELRTEVVRAKERTGRVRGEAYVNNQLVTETSFMFMLVDKKMIHPTAIVDSSAEIDENVSIGPYTIIGPKTKIYKNTIIGAHSNIEYTTIHENSQIGPYVVIGAAPQDKKYKNEPTGVIIHPNVIIREFSTIHRATVPESNTIIGEDSYLMAYTHIAHDCIIGRDVTTANCTTLAGHVVIEDGVTISGLVAIHQFVRVGKLAMLGGGAMVNQFIPPFTLACGDRARLYGINVIGLRRNGYSKDVIQKLKRAFREVFLSRRPLTDSLEKLELEDWGEDVKYFLDFIKKYKSVRAGICRAIRVKK